MKTLTQIILFSFLGIGEVALAQTSSAARQPWESSSVKIAEAKKRSLQTHGLAAQDIVIDVARPLAEASLVSVSKWSGLLEIEAQFKHLRDERFVADPDHQGKVRRESWLYPDDGCFARAALMNQNLQKWQKDPVSKIFVFGDLNVATANSDTGFVTWWYHVAPIVSDGTEPFILDPSIEPKHPLKLKDWLKKMGAIEDLRIAICSSHSYTPESLCSTNSDAEEKNAYDDQVIFLPMEYERLQILGRDPEAELGENPPWAINHNQKQKN